MKRIEARAHDQLGRLTTQSDEMWDRITPRDQDSSTFRYLEIGAVGLQSDAYTLERMPIADAPSRARMVLRAGDVLVSTTRPHRGAIVRIRDEDEGAIASTGFAVLRNPNTRKVSRDFLLAALLSDCVLTQMLQRSSGGAYPAITPDELDRVRIPTPEPNVQTRLVAALEAARVSRRRKLEDSDALLGGLDAFVLEALGLTLPPPDGRTVYAVRLREARQRFDPDYNSPRFRTLRNKIERGTFPSETVGNLFDPIVSGFAAGGDDQTDDPRVGVPHIRPLNISNTAELHFDGTKMVPRSAVEPGDFLKQGEILFNNTNSTAWVGKTVVFDVNRECACSNHITRLTLIDPKHSPHFFAALFNALRGIGYFALLSTNFNNQAGVNVDTLKAVRCPVPNSTMQKQIAAEVSRRRDAARRLREDADRIWDEAKRQFEDALLGPAT